MRLSVVVSTYRLRFIAVSASMPKSSRLIKVVSFASTWSLVSISVDWVCAPLRPERSCSLLMLPCKTKVPSVGSTMTRCACLMKRLYCWDCERDILPELSETTAPRISTLNSIGVFF